MIIDRDEHILQELPEDGYLCVHGDATDKSDGAEGKDVCKR